VGIKILKKKRSYRLLIVYFLAFLLALSNIFGAKTADYVNKSDVENAKKIFIYEVPKKVQAEKKENSDNKRKNSNKKDNKDNNPVTKKEENKSQGQNQNNVQQTVKEVKKKTGEVDLEYRNVKDITEKLNGFFGFEVIGIDNKRITQIQSYNLRGTLNKQGNKRTSRTEIQPDCWAVPFGKGDAGYL